MPSRSVFDESNFQWVREHGTLHVPDIREQNDFQMLASEANLRTFLSVPLRQQGELIGLMNARRSEVRPFTPAQIKLSKPSPTRLSSPSKTCGCSKNSRNRWSSKPRQVKFWGSLPARRRIFSRCWMRSPRVPLDFAIQSMLKSSGWRATMAADSSHLIGPMAHLPGNVTVPLDRGSAVGRALADRQTIHLVDPLSEPESEFPTARELARTSWQSNNSWDSLAA